MRGEEHLPNGIAEAWKETAEIVSDPGALSAIEDGLAEIERGEVIELAELRRELSAN